MLLRRLRARDTSHDHGSGSVQARRASWHRSKRWQGRARSASLLHSEADQWVDSTVLAHMMTLLNERYDYGLDLSLLSIDEGISGYRDASLEVCILSQWDSDC